jgi:hypothetical protein
MSRAEGSHVARWRHITVRAPSSSSRRGCLPVAHPEAVHSRIGCEVEVAHQHHRARCCGQQRRQALADEGALPGCLVGQVGAHQQQVVASPGQVEAEEAAICCCLHAGLRHTHRPTPHQAIPHQHTHSRAVR